MFLNAYFLLIKIASNGIIKAERHHQLPDDGILLLQRERLINIAITYNTIDKIKYTIPFVGIARNGVINAIKNINHTIFACSVLVYSQDKPILSSEHGLLHLFDFFDLNINGTL